MNKKSIDLYGITSQGMNDAIDRIIIEIYNKRKLPDNAQKILLTGCATQCGSTSTSIALGISFSAAKWKTLIVDCDIRKSSSLKKLNEDTNIGLSDYLFDESKSRSINFDEIIYGTNFENLSYVPAGKYAANPARLFCSGMMKEFIEYANTQFDYVLFDFPSISVSPDAQTLFSTVDGIILVTALEGVTKKQIRDAKHKIIPFSEKYYGMIINKIDMSLFKKYVKRYDYYFTDNKGNQKLGKSKFSQSLKAKKEAVKEGN